MAHLRTPDPEFAARVSASFAKQDFMGLLDAELDRIDPGEVDIGLDYRADLTQQHDFIHGGAVAAIADSAAGYAAMTLTSPDEEVLTVEFKVNFCAPATGRRLRAEGRVLKPGRTLLLTESRVLAIADDGAETLCAKMQQTIIRRSSGA